MSRFKDKSVIVTGSSGGIGRETAIGFAKEGAKLMLADVKEAENAETLSMVQSLGAEAVTLSVDVTNEAQVKQMVDTTVEQFGSVDIAINNAGIAQPILPTHELDNACFDRVFAVNVKGVWWCMKYQIQQMLKQGKGAIVNTASTAAVHGSPCHAFYGASKHAVIGLTKSAALEYASKGIRINALGPGPTITPMNSAAREENPDFHDIGAHGTAIKRMAEASEQATAILFLASEEASFVVGHHLVVDGGFSID